MENAECSLCCNAFDESDEARVPRLLPCGHTFCHECLQRLAGFRATSLECPNRCSSEANISENGIQGLPRNFALIDAQRSQCQKWPAENDERARLAELKRKAIEAEDYDLAKQLKAAIDALAADPRVSCGVCSCEFGTLGQLVKVSPTAPAGLHLTKPTVVCLLDRSPSMGQTIIWAINHAMPRALERLGYQAHETVILITFDSVAERVQLGGRDPTVGELPTLDVKLRGRTTLMARAMQLLGRVLAQGGAFNVFVISDGFLMDMVQSLERAEEAVLTVPAAARVAFAMFRFFNGKPPDTQALAAAASLGTIGTAPCTDCVVRRESLETAMDNFIATAEEAFARTLTQHVVLEGAFFQRLPGMSAIRRVEVPCNQETILIVRGCLQDLRFNGQQVTIQDDADGGSIVSDYCRFALAQLRLWLVGQVRHNDFLRSTHSFRCLAELQDGGTLEAGESMLGRAAILKRCRADAESPLARVEALADAQHFVKELNSKQQGDFLRGASVARAERLLARRGLGSDIVYHDAVRQALQEINVHEIVVANPHDSPSGHEEMAYASIYGGSVYGDVLQAAVMLAPVADDLTTAEVLRIIGGVGVPFAARLSAHANDPWTLEVTGVDSGLYLAESDMWEASCAGEPLRLTSGEPVAGVAPLSVCGAAVHETYFRGPLRPVALLQLASQLRGVLPEKAWGWDAHAPPFTLEDGAAARAAAMLSFLAKERVGSIKTPSPSEVTLISELLVQLQAWASSDDLATKLATGGSGSSGSSLQHFAAAFAATDTLSPVAIRGLCELEVRRELQRASKQHGLTTLDARRSAVLALIANDAAAQVMEVTQEAVLWKLQQRLDPAAAAAEKNEALPVHNDTVAPDSCLEQRLRKLAWMPSMDRIFGLLRIRKSEFAEPLPHGVMILFDGENGDVSAESESAFVVALVCNSLMGGETRASESSFAQTLCTRQKTRDELKRLLRHALENNYNSRLRKELMQLLAGRREQMQQSHEREQAPGTALCLDAILQEAPMGWGSTPNGEPHIGCVICGAAGAGKSTAIGRLLFELGFLDRKAMERSAAEASRLGKPSHAFAFATDKMKLEREQGCTISVSKRDFCTDRWHYTIADCPGRLIYLRNALIGFAQADVGVLMVPADSGFEAALARPGIAVDAAPGEARQHAQLLLVAGISQLIVCVTKMDSASARYGQERFDEVVLAVKQMLVQVGWKEAIVETRVPFIPLAAWDGENVAQPSTQMAWWKGCTVKPSATDCRTVVTFAEALNEVVVQPERQVHKPFRMPITGIFKIKGVGDVVTGRITQGRVSVGEEVFYRGTSSLKGKIASCEMHHRPHQHPSAGDIVGFCLKGLQKCNMPRVGDVLCQGTDLLPPVSFFVATVQVLGVPNSLRLHWTPVCFAHSMRGTVRLKKIFWRSGRDTGGAKLHDPKELWAHDVASVEFEACLHALAVEPFDQCPELGRVILADGNQAIAFGKVTATR